MYDELSFADDHLLCIPANLIIPAYTNAPFLLIVSEKGRVHNLFTHAFVIEFFARLSCVIKRNIDSILQQDKKPEYSKESTRE